MTKSQVIKVLHQQHSIEHYHPKKQLDILWPCLRFAVSLQARAHQSLNLFESTLLQLFADGGRDIEKLNLLMGFTVEGRQGSSLAEFLSRKLQQLGLITERLDLTEKGKLMVDQISQAETQVIGATIYFDLVNQCWLPMISRGELPLTNTEMTADERVKFSQGTVGRCKEIKALPILIPSDQTLEVQPPRERDVIDIIKHSRQQKKKLNLISGGEGHDGLMTNSGSISVNPESEEVYLHCYVFSVPGSKCLYVSNGFHDTTQERLTRGFNDPRKIARYSSLRKARDLLRKRGSKSHQRHFLRESESLVDIYRYLVTSKVNNISEKNKFDSKLTEFISKGYSELELTLAQCFAFSKLKSCIDELSSDPLRNGVLASNIASELGFKIKNDKLIKKLLHVNKGSVVHLKADQPVMTPLLVCHLLVAQNDDQQPMAQLVKQYPNLLDDIALLRYWRNSIDHGDTIDVVNKAKDKDIDFIYQLINKVREILSGWTKNHNDRVLYQSIPDWLEEDIRSKAHAKLENYFELMCTRMGDRVYQNLFDSLVLTNSTDARGRTNALASALQHALYKACQSLDASDAQDIEFAKRQLTELGVEQLTKSNVHKINFALNSGNATLGANFVAFWAQLTEQQQNELKQSEHLIKSVDELDKIRGHSGEILDQHETLNKIEKEIFLLIKRLMEQYCG